MKEVVVLVLGCFVFLRTLSNPESGKYSIKDVVDPCPLVLHVSRASLNPELGKYKESSGSRKSRSCNGLDMLQRVRNCRILLLLLLLLL